MGMLHSGIDFPEGEKTACSHDFKKKAHIARIHALNGPVYLIVLRAAPAYLFLHYGFHRILHLIHIDDACVSHFFFVKSRKTLRHFNTGLFR